MRSLESRIKRLENTRILSKDKIEKLSLEYIQLALKGKYNEATEQMKEAFELKNSDSEELSIWMSRK